MPRSERGDGMHEGREYGELRGRRIADLGTAGAVLVQLVRLWLAASCNGNESAAGWREGCRAAGMGPAKQASFEALMRVMVAAVPSNLRVATPRCPYVAADEALLVRVVALIQRRRHAEAENALAQRMPPAAARLALPDAVGVAVALGKRGLRLAFDGSSVGAVPALAALPDRGLLLLQ